MRSFAEVTSVIKQVETQGLAPELSLGGRALDFGNVFYRAEATTVLRIANVGQG